MLVTAWERGDVRASPLGNATVLQGSSVVGLTWVQVGFAAAPTVAVWRCDLFVPTLSRSLCVSLCFGKPKYAGVQMAISKVHKAQTFLGIVSRSATPVIQIVLIDDRAGGQAGTAAEQLAADIMESIAQHGNTPVLLSSSPAVHPDTPLATALYSLPAAHMSSGVGVSLRMEVPHLLAACLHN